MNERIQKLKDQCWVEKRWDNDMWIEKHIDQEKFAELIVKECTDLVQKYMSRWPEDHELTKQIKHHFGVEE
jgi:hypothetical protein